MICSLVSFIVVLLVLLKIYIKLTTGWCRSQSCLVGKTAIITGANSGIGYETALDFAKRGARVILACRDRQRANKALMKIIQETGNENIVVKIVDVGSFESIRAFVKDIIETESQLNILVNNAGAVGIESHARSKEGLLSEMQINYYGPFLLTLLLIDLLKKTKSSRIVNVASMAAKHIQVLDIKEINTAENQLMNYSKSKLCNILFTIELARRLKPFGVSTYCLHPGIVQTEIFRDTKGIGRIILNIVAKLFFKTSEEGAQTTIYCSVTKGLEEYSGQHFVDCRKTCHYKSASIPSLPTELWNTTIKILNLDPNEIKI